MAKDSHVRLTDDQSQKLGRLSAKLGVSENEIIRRLLDNADEVSLKTIARNRDADELILANLKQQNWLLSNLTNNLNQVTHFLNQHQNDLTLDEMKILAKIFNQFYGSVQNLRKELHGHGRK